jgi:hypothetical protein
MYRNAILARDALQSIHAAGANDDLITVPSKGNGCGCAYA